MIQLLLAYFVVSCLDIVLARTLAVILLFKNVVLFELYLFVSTLHTLSTFKQSVLISLATENHI